MILKGKRTHITLLIYLISTEKNYIDYLHRVQNARPRHFGDERNKQALTTWNYAVREGQYTTLLLSHSEDPKEFKNPMPTCA